MALRGKKGVALTGLDSADAGLLFGEDQGRYLVTVAAGDVAAVANARRCAAYGSPTSIEERSTSTSCSCPLQLSMAACDDVQ